MNSTASSSRLAVIGSAGRGLDGRSITRELYAAMYRLTVMTMQEHGIRHLVSGGAAYSDHMAVLAYLNGDAAHLTLHLPAPFLADGADVFDVTAGGQAGQAAGTANRYHRQMESSIRVPGLSLIAKAIEKGAAVTVSSGFHARNSLVAAEADVVLAFTFGKPGKTSSLYYVDSFVTGNDGHASYVEAGLKDGGTADTWNKAQRAQVKSHVDLMGLKLGLTSGAVPPILGSDLNRILFPGVDPAPRSSSAAPSMGV